MSNIINVLIFTCENREHLLTKAWEAYAPILKSFNHRLILAIDGKVDAKAIELLHPEIVVQNFQRRGYINSIFNALAVIDSEYFLWLEDDWTFNTAAKVQAALTVLAQHPSWIQVRWSKEAPLMANDTILAPGFAFSSAGFSANPSVCRTALVREGFKFLREAPRGNTLGVDGFENVLTRWALSHGWVCAVVDPGDKPTVSHIGALESTGRQWHMTASMDILPKEHLPVSGAPPALWRRFWMVFKLLRIFLLVSWRQLFGNAAYDLAFRIIVSEKTLSENRDEVIDKSNHGH